MRWGLVWFGNGMLERWNSGNCWMRRKTGVWYTSWNRPTNMWKVYRILSDNEQLIYRLNMRQYARELPRYKVESELPSVSYLRVLHHLLFFPVSCPLPLPSPSLRSSPCEFSTRFQRFLHGIIISVETDYSCGSSELRLCIFLKSVVVFIGGSRYCWLVLLF